MEMVKKASRSNKKELDTIQSNLSFSYLHAVVSRVGGSCESTGRTADNMGIDVTLMFQGQFSPKLVYQTIPIIGQLKSTRQPLRIANGKISYSLCSKQYRKYTQSSTTEFLLFLFALPEIAVNSATACKMLGISAGTLTLWTKKGLIPHRRIGGRILYSVEALKEFASGKKSE